METIRARVVTITQQLREAFEDRADAVEVIVLAILTGANFLLVGDPGTAKSLLIRCMLRHVEGATQFEHLCGSFSTLDELVGPVDIKQFREGSWGRVTDGRMAAVDYAFLDEVFKASGGLLNTLLELLNERRFQGAGVPLRAVGAACNWPELRARGEHVDALIDRFLLRAIVDDLAGVALRGVMSTGGVQGYAPRVRISLQDLDEARAQIRRVQVDDRVVDSAASLVEKCRTEGVRVSTRRAVQSLGVIRARAWLHGRDRAGIEDLGVMRFMCWETVEDLRVVDAALADLDREVMQALEARINAALSQVQGLVAGSEEACVAGADEAAEQAAQALDEVASVAASGMLGTTTKQSLKALVGVLEEQLGAMTSRLDTIAGCM